MRVFSRPQNFKALFESIEAYQVARGVLRAEPQFTTRMRCASLSAT
jgi:hypothetical protein